MSGAHTKGPYTVHVVPVASPLIAAMELSTLVHGTKNFSGVLPMVVAANGLCVAVTGCGPDGLKNAALFSAATDMLEALQGVLRVADRATVEFDAVRAAIAKATGQQGGAA